MPAPTAFIIVLAIAGLVVHAAHADQACDKSFLDSLRSDDTLTHIQRMAAATERCEGRAIVVEGSISDVSQIKIDLDGHDGLRVDAYVAQLHNCGDLVSLRKGQRVAVSGIIRGAYPHINKVSISNAVCTK